MFRRIEPHQVELGMFIHKLEGRWVDHPFWRAKFLLKDRTRLHKLRASALTAVVIDTERGLDILDEDEPAVEPAMVRTTEPPAPQQDLPPAVAQPLRRNLQPRRAVKATGNLVSVPPQAMAREFGRARDIAVRSHRTVSRAFLKVRLGKGFKTSMVEPVIDDILASVERNAHAFNGLMQCREDNQSLYRHALATSALMISLARRLRLPSEQLRQAGLAGLMLDVGINRLPVDLALIDHDLARIPADIFESHIELGHELCLEADVPEAVANAVMEHHERTDGRGFPRGLRRAEISPLGRMAAICASYEDMVNGGSGRRMNPAEAMAALADQAGAYDEPLLAAFTEAMGIYPVGTVLLLGSRRLAMVVDQNEGDPTKPRVVTFFSTVSGHKIAPEMIDLGDTDSDAIDSLARPEVYGIPDFPALREKLFGHASMN